MTSISGFSASNAATIFSKAGACSPGQPCITLTTFVCAKPAIPTRASTDKITSAFEKNHRKKLLLVEGKYDVAWFEKGLSLLDEFRNYRVIPCGGYGNIQYVKEQLEKEGYTTVTITDGDVSGDDSLKRDVIELYADLDYVNARFNTSFKEMPNRKREFFKRFHVKDDVVKKVLSSWAKKHLKLDSAFVLELDEILG